MAKHQTVLMTFSASLRCIAVTACLFLSASGFAQLDTTAITTRLNQLKDKIGKDAAFVLYKDGKIIYKKETGEYTVKTKVPIGASSQWLTAVLVMTFVQDGIISLDDKVSSYLPIFSKYLKSYITIRHCLTHYTGIKGDEELSRLLMSSKFATLDEEVIDIASKHDIQTNPGTEFRYSNIGYNILGRVLEVVSKRNLDRLVQDRLLRPLAMKSTTFANEDYTSGTNPSTGALSSAADLAGFMGMLLNKGTVNGKKMLSEESVQFLQSLQVDATATKYSPKINAGLPYAAGAWILETTPSNKVQSLGVPSLKGTWPMMDVCRKYAFVLVAKNPTAEQDRKLYMSLKTMIDEMMPGSCD